MIPLKIQSAFLHFISLPQGSSQTMHLGKVTGSESGSGSGSGSGFGFDSDVGMGEDLG